MNKLNDKKFIKQLFQNKLAGILPAVKHLDEINIETIKKARKKNHFHLVNYYSLRQADKKITGIIGTAHSKGNKKNIFKILKYLYPFFNQEGLLSVKPLFYHDQEKVMFYEAIEGSNLFSWLENNKPINDILPLAADWLAKLHQISPPSHLKIHQFNLQDYDPTKILQKKFGMVDAYRKTVKKYYKLLMTKKPKLNDNLVFCHGDAHPENLIISSKSNQVAFVDLNDACLSSPAFDVGSFSIQLEYMAGQHYSDKKAAQLSNIFLDEYLKKTKLTNQKEFFQQLKFFQSWTALKGMLYCLVIPTKKGVIKFEKIFLKLIS